MTDLRDPFNPKTGEFRDNIRAIIPPDDSELRASLKQFGWRKEHPAYKDERGVVLVGHRRLKIAKALGIAPVIVELTLGDGDEADAERFKIAITSNIGGAVMAKEDRKRLAEHLYGEREWTMQRIAEALNTTHKTISKDLSGFVPKVQTSRPKGGRPKGSGKGQSSGARSSRRNRSPERQTQEDLAAGLVIDKKVTLEQAAAQTGLQSVQTVKIAVAREEARREVREEPEIEKKTLSMTAQEKLDAAIRQHKRKIDLDFEYRVLQECQKRLNELSLPQYAKELSEMVRLITSRKGVMDRVTYNKIRFCLHSDHVQDPTLKRRHDEALAIFNNLEKVLLSEKESPTEFKKWPKSYEEAMAMRAAASAKRKQGNKSAPRRA